MTVKREECADMTTLARRLNAFDATMIVMGGIIGSGIFINPYVVARQLHSTPLILAAWTAGGVVALLGAFVYAELTAIRPEAGGQYAYLLPMRITRPRRSCTAGRCCSSCRAAGWRRWRSPSRATRSN